MQFTMQHFTRGELDARGWTYTDDGWYVLWDGATEPVGPDADGPFETAARAATHAEEEFANRGEVAELSEAWAEMTEAYHDQHAEF